MGGSVDAVPAEVVEGGTSGGVDADPPAAPPEVDVAVAVAVAPLPPSFSLSTYSEKMSRNRDHDFSGMVMAFRKFVFTWKFKIKPSINHSKCAYTP